MATDIGALQERITSTKKGSITSVQAVYVPADDLTDPAPATTFAHLDATTVLSRQIAELGIYPAVDPLDSTSRIVDPNIIGEEHYHVARGVQKCYSVIKNCKILLRFLVWMSFPMKTSLLYQEHVKCNVSCQPFFVAEAFTGTPGKYVPLKETIRGFKEILSGKHDELPEAAFYMAGSIDEVVEKARTMKGE